MVANWLSLIFGPALPPPPVPMNPDPGGLTSVLNGQAVLLPPPSPVPGCDQRLRPWICGAGTTPKPGFMWRR